MARDYLNGDHSFKRWFKIMWKNSYIQIFTVALVAVIVQLFKFGTMVDLIVDNFIRRDSK